MTMAIATKHQYWNSRLTGEDPTDPVSTNENDAWVLGGGGSAGSASGGAWVTTNSTYNIGGSGDSITMVAMLSFNTAPNTDDVIMRLDTGSKRVEVKSRGNLTELALVGTSTVIITDLDLGMSEENAVPLLLRLTLDATGNAYLYTHEIINDTDGNSAFYSVTANSGSGGNSTFGNTSGSVNWFTVYFSKFGAFNPEELMLSAFAQDTLARMGLTVVETLKNCTRPFIKKYVDDSSIVYGYDLSSQMLNRMKTPTIHIVFTSISSPNFTTLGGAAIEQFYEITAYVTTKGSNYEGAYRLGLNILGEIFDELYTTTGLSASTDNLESFNMQLDSKMDDDETVCVHQINITYKRRIKMTRR